MNNEKNGSFVNDWYDSSIFSRLWGGTSPKEVKKPADVSIEATDKAGEADKTDKADNTSDDKASEKTATSNAGSETVEETVLLDEAGLKITAKSLDLDGFLGPELKLLIENNSDKDLTVQSRGTSVNGYMVESMISASVAAGKKANDGMTLSKTQLKASGIESIADMEFKFHVFNSDDFEKYLDTDTIKLSTSSAGTYEQVYDDSGKLAYEGNDIKILVKELEEYESIFGPSIVVYVENNRNEAITVQARDVSVNGFMVDPIFSCNVEPGKRAIDAITLMGSDIKENEISDIKDIELSFKVFGPSLMDTVVDTEIIGISF